LFKSLQNTSKLKKVLNKTEIYKNVENAYQMYSFFPEKPNLPIFFHRYKELFFKKKKSLKLASFEL